MKKALLELLFFTICSMSINAQHAEDLLDLSGTWSFQLDPGKVGEKESWFNLDLKDEIRLPGTTDENGFGVKASKPELTRLTRQRSFYGPAWYQKIVDIPQSWTGRHIELLLERVLWESKVWVDDHFVGMQESICTPHRFDISDFISPGPHRITIRIDNRYKYNIGVATSGRMGSPMWTMAVTDESQTTWNGAIGRIEISATDPVWIERYETYPVIADNQLRVVVVLRNRSGIAAEGNVTASIVDDRDTLASAFAAFANKTDDSPVLDGANSVLLNQVSGPFYMHSSETRVEIILPLKKEIKLWDEFSPAQYTMKIDVQAKDKSDRSYHHQRAGKIGIREFTVNGKQFSLNGRNIFLRGNQDNCVHPLTGYPPMDLQYWIAFLKKYKDYGLNHIRFHSWCPPEAAFAAADELGMMLQVEAPMWDGYGYVGKLADRAAFLRYESERILDEYGNHPSFCMYSLGNELGDGTEYYLQYMVEVLRARDDRHLYTCASAPASNLRNDDYVVGANGITGDWACSLTETCFRGLKQWKGRNAGDVRDQIKTMTRPLIAHEIGQQTSFPDFYSWFNEKKYTGQLKADYIEVFRKRFEKYHSPKMGSAYAKASGQFQLLLYKAEIEIMLRTPNLAGFHLNGLSDYPGEGVALIGILDALMDSKEIASPETFRQFCSETVPLARLPRQTWIAGEQFEAEVDVRHNGPHDLTNTRWRWRISDETGKTLNDEAFAAREISTGKLTSLGQISTRLPKFTKARELTLTVSSVEGKTSNSWKFWVYPEDKSFSLSATSHILIAHEWNDEVKERLRSGGKVLLLPRRESVAKAVKADFFPVFWSKQESSESPHFMGLYCNPLHPALAEFPTRSYCDWQWYDLLTDCYALNINELPFGFQPIVHLIDFFKSNNRLAMIFEAKVGKGSLLVCTLNLGDGTARTLSQQQMLKSLTTYVSSKAFHPVESLSVQQLDTILKNNLHEL